VTSAAGPPPAPPPAAAPSSTSGGGIAGAQAWARTHRAQILAGLFAAAALLGLRARSKGASAQPSTGAGTTGAAAGESTFTGAGGAYYDSTANDVYNAIEPQIAALAAAIAAQQQQATTPTDPVVTPPAPTGSPVSQGRHVAPGTVWGVGSQNPGTVPAPTPTGGGTTHPGGSWGQTGNR
jgi:hypothetical protein